MKPNRREMLRRSAFSVAMGGGSMKAAGQSGRQNQEDETWFMPDESHEHRGTWMAFGAQRRIWSDLLPDVRRNLALVANTISKYEPVFMLVRPEERRVAAPMCDAAIQFIDAPLDDLWIRDTGPTFVLNSDGALRGIDLNFNGWGGKQGCDRDAMVARFVCRQARAEHFISELVGEGGGIETDGHGTAIVTESCFVNRNRNPGVGKEDCEFILKSMLGLRKIIWLPGVRGKDITDGHTDFYARFAGPGVVIAGLETDRQSFDYDVTREHLKILRAARDASGRKLEVVTLESPKRIRRELESEDFAAGYINFYVINGAVIAPEFGDTRADQKCYQVLRKFFPGRDIVQLNIDAIAAGGGGIHCATQQEPKSGG